MKTYVNESGVDRTIRLIIAALLLIAGMETQHTLSVVLYVVGAIVGLTGVTGFCLLYRLFGINTNRRRES